MDMDRLELERIAVKHFANIIREEIHLNRGVPVKKHQLGGILNENASYIVKHVKKHYSPQPLRNFLAAHPKVFFVFGSRKGTEVDVASEMAVADYVYFLDAKSFPSEFKSEESRSVVDIEEEAIIFFSNAFRNRALQDKSCTSGVIPKIDFPIIFCLAPQDIREFVLKDYKRKNLPSSFDQFINQHSKIFPESVSGFSVRVKSDAEVLAYIAEIFYSSDQEDSSSSERNSSTPESQSSASTTGSTPLLPCDDKTVIIYFEAQFRNYLIRNVMNWIKLDNLALFYRDAPANIINYLKIYYGRFYLSTFLHKYRAIFPKSPCGLFFTILSNAEVKNYLATIPILQPSQSIQSSSSFSSNSTGASRPLLDTPKPINLQDFLVPTLKTSPKQAINFGNSTLTSNNTTLTTNPGLSLFANVSSQETLKTTHFGQSTSSANTSTPTSQTIFGNTLNARGVNPIIPTQYNASNFGLSLTSNQTVTSLNNPICSNPPALIQTAPPTTTLTSTASLYPTLYKSPDIVQPLSGLTPINAIPSLNNVRTNFGQPLLPIHPMLNNARFNFGQPLLNFPNPGQVVPTLNNVRSNFGQPLLRPNTHQVIPTLNNAPTHFGQPLLRPNTNQANPSSQIYPLSNFGQSLYQGHALQTKSASTANSSYFGQTSLINKDVTNQLTNSQTSVGESTIERDDIKAEAVKDGEYENLVQELTAEIFKQFEKFPTHVEAPDIKKENDTESTTKTIPEVIPEITTFQTAPKFNYSSGELESIKDEATSEVIPEITTSQTAPKFIYSSDKLKSIKDEATFVDANYKYDDYLQDLFSKTIFTLECDSDELAKQPNIASCQTLSSGEILSLKFYQH